MANDYQGIKNRFKKFRLDTNLSQIKLANAIGVDKTTISKIENPTDLNRLPSLRIVMALEEYFGLNRNWLETGEGPMRNTFKVRQEARPVHLASDPDGEFNQKFTELGDGTIAMKVPIVTQRAYAGYLRGYADPEYFDDMPTLVVDVYKEHKGNYIAFEVCGDSMTTLDPKEFRMSIFDGTFVVGREVSRHLWSYKLHTHYVDNWVIVHKTEGILIKKIINHDVESGKITIHSLNPDKQKYPDQVLNLDDVQQIFNIVQKIDKM